MGLSAEVVVVGAGVNGLSTAHALTALGVRDVTVFDRATVSSGGTGKSSAIVRCHYGVRSLAAMAWRSLQVLADSEAILGADCGYRRTGYLVGVDARNLGALRANVGMHRELGIDVDLISHEEAQALLPWADLGDFAAFAYEPRGGYGDGAMTAQAFAAAAKVAGARVVQNCAVRALRTKAERICGIELANGEIVNTSCVVLAAGPWSVALAAGVGVDLPIRAQRAQILLIDPGVPVREIPVFSDLVALQYVRREGDLLLVGNSDHSDPEWTDPDHYAERASGGELLRMVSKLQDRFAGLDGAQLVSSYAGCYDVTPDYNPVISASPIDGLWLCAGFSGHGYKISPAVGELMADLITSGTSRHPDIDHEDFRWARFTQFEPLTSPHPYGGAGQMR